MKISLRVVVPVSAAVLVLAGCGSGSDSTGAAAATSAPSASLAATDVPTPTASSAPSTAPAAPAKPKGFTLVVDKANGYQFAVPSGYKRISKRSDLDKVMKAGQKELNRQGLAAQLDNKTLKSLTVSPLTGNAINMVVTQAGGVTVDQLDEMKDVLKQQVKTIGATSIHAKTATLGGQAADRLDYVLKFQGTKVKTVQYVTVKDDTVFTLTFSERVTIPAATEKKVVDSFRAL